MGRTTILKVSLGALSLAQALAVSSVQAQAVPPDTAEEGEAGFAATEIVVTAQKREQRLEDVPISVNVVSGEQLRANYLSDVRDLSTYVPNLTVGDTPGENQVAIRGLSTGPRNNLFEQAVTTTVDGIVGARALQFAIPFFDVERVEVLRGPQGVLFGKNSTAGAINITTAGPTGQLSGAVGAMYEAEHQGWGIDGFLAGPLTDAIGARLAVKYERLGGFIRDTNLNRDHGVEQTIAVRGIVQLDPTDSLRIRLKGELAQVDRRGAFLQFGACTTNLSRVLLVSPTEDCTLNFRTAQTVLGGIDTKSGVGSINVDYELGDYTLSSISGYSTYDSLLDRDLDLTPVNAIRRVKDEDYRQLYQEFRVTSPADRFLSFVTGVTYQDQDLELDDQQDLNVLILPYTNATTAPFNAQLNSRTRKFVNQGTRAWSAYGQFTFNVSSRFRAIAGARYTRERKRISYLLNRFVFGTDTRVVTPLDINIPRASRTEGNLDPQVTFQFDATDDIMIYATGSIVHKAGGYNMDESNGTQIARTFEYRPEEAKGLEVGLKAKLTRGLFTVAAFNTDFKDLQVSSFDGVTTFVRNAAEARTRGVEADAIVHLTEVFTLRAALAYLDAKFTRYPGGSCTAAQAAAVAPAPCTADLSGKRLTFAPEWTASAGVDARVPVAPNWRFVGGANLSFSDKLFPQENNDPLMRIPSIAKLDLRAGLESEDRHWSVTLTGKNVTNEIRPGFEFVIRNAPGAYGASTPRGREVFLETRYRW